MAASIAKISPALVHRHAHQELFSSLHRSITALFGGHSLKVSVVCVAGELFFFSLARVWDGACVKQ